MFNTYINGALTIEIKRVRGVFEVMIIMCTHEDTPEVHAILKLHEKTMVLYPNIMFERLETHCSLSEKYGFKSDIFAESYLRHMLVLKEKIDKNKMLLHQTHQSMREIHLAYKMLIYFSVANKPSHENLELVNHLVSSLFVSNIWICFADQEHHDHTFFSNPSFLNLLFFKRSNLSNLTNEFKSRNRIKKIADKLKLKNISNSFNLIMD